MRIFDAQVARDYLSNALPGGGINSTPQQSPYFGEISTPMNRGGFGELSTPINRGGFMPPSTSSNGNLANNISMAIPEAVRPVIAQQLQQTASNLNSGIAGLIGDTFGTQGSPAMQGSPVMQQNIQNNLRQNTLGSLGNIMNMTQPFRMS